MNARNNGFGRRLKKQSGAIFLRSPGLQIPPWDTQHRAARLFREAAFYFADVRVAKRCVTFRRDNQKYRLRGLSDLGKV